MIVRLVNILCLLLTFTVLQFGSARPTLLQEQDLSYYKSLYHGFYVGYETLLALLGYDEDEVVKDNLKRKSLIIDDKDEETQTKMQVVCLGLGRTGTTSLAMALEILGYTVVHDDEHTALTDVYAAWENDEIDIDGVHEIMGLRGYNATFKTAGYKWVAEHTEVKAILTVRDNPDKYVDSWLVAAPFVDILKQPPFRWMATVDELMASFLEEYKMDTTGGEPEKYLDRETLRASYLEYIENAQEAIPLERLLTFNVKQGWEPLCEYLGHDVPDMPFPHVHTRAKLQGEMLFLRMITWIWSLGIILPLLLLKSWVLEKKCAKDCFETGLRNRVSTHENPS